MVRFCDKLKIASFCLRELDCIAKYSFLVLKSVTYLDLSLCELSRLRGKRSNVIYPNKLSSRSTIVTSNFVCTEEGCKKDLAENRRILYDLHLDVSFGLELRFGNNHKNSDIRYHSDRVLLNKLCVESSFLEMRLERMANGAFYNRTNEEVKMLHRISKTAQRIKFIGTYGYIRTVGPDILYSKCCDSNVVKDFLIAMKLEDGHLLKLKLENVEYLLYHASCAGYILRDNPPLAELINTAIYERMFKYVPTLLKYRDTPRFCETIYSEMDVDIKTLRAHWKAPFGDLSAPVRKGLHTKERNFLLTQIVYIFFFDRDNGLETMQLVWRSVPQAFFSLDELIASDPKLDGTEFLEGVHNFICDITGTETLHPVPRNLKHYCRTAIRKALSRNAKLFSGIDEISVPPEMLSFLKLEC